MYRKTEVKPFIMASEKEIIYKIKSITGFSVNNICTDLCQNAIKNDVLSDLSQHFRRSVKIGNDYFEANTNPLPLKKKKRSTKTERISLQLDDSIYEFAYNLSYAMSCSVAKAVALMLEKTMNDNKEIITGYIEDFILEKLNANEYNDLLKLIASINSNFSEENQPFSQDEILTSFVFYIFDEIKHVEESMENALLRVVNSWF